jgi:predicted nucleic acid-binding Zn ribbon protein
METKSITCPDCGKRAKKIISACSFKLVGGGWYADGYSSSKSSDKSDKKDKN